MLQGIDLGVPVQRENKNKTPNRIFYQTEYLRYYSIFVEKKIYVRCLYRYSKRAEQEVFTGAIKNS